MFIKDKAYFVLIGFFIFNFLIGQNQQLADSLILQYESGLYDEDELEMLRIIAEEETNPQVKLYFSDLLINKASVDSSFYHLYTGFSQRGYAFQFKGQNTKGLEAFFEALRFAHRIEDESGVGSVLVSIADSYNSIGNSVNAQKYYRRGIAALRELNDSIKIATALLNAGDEFFYNNKIDSAFIYTKEAEVIFKKKDISIGQAYCLGNLGMIHGEKGNDKQAEENIFKAITILEELEDYYPISVYLIYMSDIYLRKNDIQKAMSYAEKSLELASLYGLKKQISEANLNISKLYEKNGDTVTSYKYYKNHIVYRDSVNNIESVQQMADLRTNHEVSQKQIEVNLLNLQKKNQRIAVIAISIALFLIGLLAIGLFRRNKFIQSTKKVIEEEKERSDKLLLNILPQETAQELKDNGKVKAKKYDNVSVMFSDFKGFTSYSENLSPEDLVETVDFYFSKFDQIIEKHGLEKIKTIGDAYMCAGGLGNSNKNHAQNAVNAAIEIASFVEKTKNDRSASDLIFDIRIGISSGPVVAGVVGTKKFAYDIWGDTVNIASRMESASEPGKINISESTFEEIRDNWTCEYRGEIQVKNKGAMKMYFVNSH